MTNPDILLQPSCISCPNLAWIARSIESTSQKITALEQLDPYQTRGDYLWQRQIEVLNDQSINDESRQKRLTLLGREALRLQRDESDSMTNHDLVEEHKAVLLAQVQAAQDRQASCMQQIDGICLVTDRATSTS